MALGVVFLLAALTYAAYVGLFWDPGWGLPHGNPLPFIDASIPWSIPWLSYSPYPQSWSVETLMSMHIAVIAIGIALNTTIAFAVGWFTVGWLRRRHRVAPTSES